MAKAVRQQLELTKGLLDRMHKDARFVQAFPFLGKYVKVVTVKIKTGCPCKRNQSFRMVKKTVVDYGGLKRHFAGMPPEQQTKLKQLLGTRLIKLAYRRPDSKMHVLTF